MADIFLNTEASRLLCQKRVVIMGDSNMRALYKDLLQLVTVSNKLLSEKCLRTKQQNSVLGDQLVKQSELTKGRDYEEERLFNNDQHYFHYIFLTRCYNERVERVIKRFYTEIQPDLIIMNSCLWDITRWGPNGVDKYKENLQTLIQRFKQSLPPTALVIWATTLPLAQKMKGGFLIPQVDFMKYQLRYEVMEANLYAWQLFSKNGFDVLDFHYHLQGQIIRRAGDGIHWAPAAVRHMTNLVLTHVALAWNVPLPGRFSGIAIERKINGFLLPNIKPILRPKTLKQGTSEKGPVSHTISRNPKEAVFDSQVCQSSLQALASLSTLRMEHNYCKLLVQQTEDNYCKHSAQHTEGNDRKLSSMHAQVCQSSFQALLSLPANHTEHSYCKLSGLQAEHNYCKPYLFSTDSSYGRETNFVSPRNHQPMLDSSPSPNTDVHSLSTDAEGSQQTALAEQQLSKQHPWVSTLDQHTGHSCLCASIGTEQELNNEWSP